MDPKKCRRKERIQMNPRRTRGKELGQKTDARNNVHGRAHFLGRGVELLQGCG